MKRFSSDGAVTFVFISFGHFMLIFSTFYVAFQAPDFLLRFPSSLKLIVAKIFSLQLEVYFSHPILTALAGVVQSSLQYYAAKVDFIIKCEMFFFCKTRANCVLVKQCTV